jgi:hypothetical protein
MAADLCTIFLRRVDVEPSTSRSVSHAGEENEAPHLRARPAADKEGARGGTRTHMTLRSWGFKR